MSSRSVLFSSFFVAVALVACGGADTAPPRAPGPSTTEPTSVEEAQDQIARAKAELGFAPPADAAKIVQQPGAAPAPPPPSTPPRKSSAEPKAESSTANADPCVSPCRAIASMRRAVGALCRMTGDDDARCSDAKKTLAESEAKVATCAC